MWEYRVNKNTLISLIVSTYNWPAALAVVLTACSRQTDRRFEIIVADDGSTDATREVIESARHLLPVHLEHVWHPDDGFRAAAIRNKAIASARGEYLIFLDGDCVPQPDFIARHRALAERGAMVTGSRILLGRSLTQSVLNTSVSLFDRGLAFWLVQKMKGESNKFLPFLAKLPGWPGRVEEGFKWRGIKGCNMAAWAKDVAAIDGFDESYKGWGHEDADFVVRLHNAGIKRKKGFMATEVLHLWHEKASRDREDVNRKRVLQCLSDRRILAQTGLTQASAEVRAEEQSAVAA